MSKFLPLLFFLLAGCSFGPGNLQSKHSTDLESRRIRRIVILPALETAGSQVKVAPVPGEPKSPERDPNDTLARIIYQVMSSLPNWQIVSESEAREVSQTITASNEAARLRQLGEAVYADAVLVGRVRRFRERVGDEWGVKSPASVAFVLDLVDVRRGDVIWSASFDETQKSLSENIFAIGDIISERGVRWLTAEQLAHEGVKKAVAQLHQLIARAAIS
jgi:TolB-like protein